MLDQDIQLLENSFKKYYFDHFDLIHVPENPSEREFGYQKFNFGMTRHLSFKTNEELRLMLITKIPSDVYCSNAYYSFPNLPMAEKDWKGADLIFDVDAKDLNLNCRNDHTGKKCNDCNETFVLETKCPKCQSTKIEEKSVTCSKCISATKTEIKKLTDILTSDFEINNEDIHVYFSGNEGFHVYVTNSQFHESSSRERNELVDYLMFRGAIPETFGMKKFKIDRAAFPEFEDAGWRGRISKPLYGSKSKRSKAITEIISKGYPSFQNQLLQLKNTIGVKIDPNVTIDIHRIFRLPGSLNSKSGLSKIKCENLDNFDPFSEACFIDDENVEVLANCPVPFELKKQKFGPYNTEKISIPKYAAIYLICKGFATTT